MESVKALHRIPNPDEEFLRVRYLESLKKAQTRSDIIIASKRYIFSVEDFRGYPCDFSNK
jgi:hypothetical protein